MKEVLMNKVLDKNNNLMNGKMVKLCFDSAFKIMYANDEHIEILTMLLSKILKMDYKLLEGNVTLLPLKATNKTVDEKKCEKDVLVSVKANKDYNIILEVNVKPNFYKSIIDRNLYYSYQIAGHRLKEGMMYSEIPHTLLINFNTFFINKDRKDVFEEFYYRDEYGYILTEKNKNLNINIEECYNLWYTNNYQGKFEPYYEDLVLLCAAMMVEKEEDFHQIVSMVQMKPEIMKLMEGLVKEMNHDEKLVTEYKTWKNEEERINASCMDEAYKTGVEEGLEQGTKQTKIEMVLNMYQANLPLETISKCTKLNIDKLREIINKKQ